MTAMSRDTSAAAEAFLIAGFRQMSPAEKMRRVVELTHAAEQMALARIRAEHPDASERELRLRLASLHLDRETMMRVFDWDPQTRGR